MTSTRDRVLITGGSGFVGACLARRLIAEGCDVHLTLRGNAKTWRLAGLEHQFTRHDADMTDGAALRRAVASARPHVVYHLAAYGAYPSQRNRSETIATNLLGTVHLLEALEDNDHRMLVNVGSSSEYGHKSQPMRETDSLEPRNDYAVSKAAATLLCQAEAYRGRPVCTVRIFSAYGPWDDPGRLVPYVMDCLLRGETPQVSAGHQPRDYIHVDDILALLEISANTPQAIGRVLNAGSGRRCIVRTMVEEIAAVCGREDSIVYGTQTMRPDEPQCWVADIEQTTAVTGWTPQITLREGLERLRTWSLERRLQSAA